MEAAVEHVLAPAAPLESGAQMPGAVEHLTHRHEGVAVKAAVVVAEVPLDGLWLSSALNGGRSRRRVASLLVAKVADERAWGLASRRLDCEHCVRLWGTGCLRLKRLKYATAQVTHSSTVATKVKMDDIVDLESVSTLVLSQVTISGRLEYLLLQEPRRSVDGS